MAAVRSLYLESYLVSEIQGFYLDDTLFCHTLTCSLLTRLAHVIASPLAARMVTLRL